MVSDMPCTISTPLWNTRDLVLLQDRQSTFRDTSSTRAPTYRRHIFTASLLVWTLGVADKVSRDTVLSSPVILPRRCAMQNQTEIQTFYTP